MRRALVTIAIAGLAFTGMSAPVNAAPPSQAECEAMGGTFTKERGTVNCTIVDPVGNSEASGGKSQTRDDETTSQGTLNNRPQKEQCQSGPGNQTTCP